MKFRTAIPSVFAVLLSACAIPSNVQEMERHQRESVELLQQQTTQMALQEQYLLRLAKTQMELNSALLALNRQISGMELDRGNDSASNDRGDAQSAESGAASTESFEVEPPAEGKLIVGRKEWVWLDVLKENFQSNVETGEPVSLLLAEDTQVFERNSRNWIRFRVPVEADAEDDELYEAPLLKYLPAEQNPSSGTERRPVVRLKVRLGDHVAETDFILCGDLDPRHPVTLGRNFLRDVILVDVAQKYTQRKYRPVEPVANAP